MTLESASLTSLAIPAGPIVETPTSLISNPANLADMAGVTGFSARALDLNLGFPSSGNGYIVLNTALQAVPQNVQYLDITRLSFFASPYELLGTSDPAHFNQFRLSVHDTTGSSNFLTTVANTHNTSSGLGTLVAPLTSSMATYTGLTNSEGNGIFKYDIDIKSGDLRIDLSSGKVSSVAFLFGAEPTDQIWNSYEFQIAGSRSSFPASPFQVGGVAGTTVRDYAAVTKTDLPPFEISGRYGSFSSGPVDPVSNVPDSGSTALMMMGSFATLAFAARRIHS